MFDDSRTPGASAQASLVAQQLSLQLTTFLAPLLQLLDAHLDARLVRTLSAAVAAILMWRHRNHGLLLSELGSYLRGPMHAPAGTKRLSNLLRSPNWTATLISDWLWQQATVRIHALRLAQEEALVIWDESVLEKPESQRSEGLCAVRSSKAQRLRRIRPGFFNPPTDRPICVAGLQWLGLLIVGASGPPSLAHMAWWTTRGTRATERRTVEAAVLQRCIGSWGRSVCHLFDRGFAGSPWLTRLLDANLRFVLRWPKGYKLLDQWADERKAWQIARGKRTWSVRQIRDTRSHELRPVGVVACSVTHPHHARPLWLVVARPGKGREPWYLLTSEPIRTADDAWQIVFAYARRWQIELMWRYTKSELAFESPRLWTWERREKLLLLATLAYAFLLSLLVATLAELRVAALRLGCHRTGKRSRDTPTPLYRLRAALSRLWLTHLTHMSHPQNSG
jgi:hypothetical protein